MTHFKRSLGTIHGHIAKTVIDGYKTFDILREVQNFEL